MNIDEDDFDIDYFEGMIDDGNDESLDEVTDESSDEYSDEDKDERKDETKDEKDEQRDEGITIKEKDITIESEYFYCESKDERFAQYDKFGNKCFKNWFVDKDEVYHKRRK